MIVEPPLKCFLTSEAKRKKQKLVFEIMRRRNEEETSCVTYSVFISPLGIAKRKTPRTLRTRGIVNKIYESFLSFDMLFLVKTFTQGNMAGDKKPEPSR